MRRDSEARKLYLSEVVHKQNILLAAEYHFAQKYTENFDRRRW
jgi:hypothetical protein